MPWKINSHENYANLLCTSGHSLFYLLQINAGWFFIQWNILPYTAHVIPINIKMADWAWIAKCEETSRRFILSKPFLLYWLFNLLLVAQWISLCLMSCFRVVDQVGCIKHQITKRAMWSSYFPFGCCVPRPLSFPVETPLWKISKALPEKGPNLHTYLLVHIPAT